MGSRILVTGADGFIGSHLVEHLIKKKDIYTAFCLYNFWIIWLDGRYIIRFKERCEIVFGDIRDKVF